MNDMPPIDRHEAVDRIGKISLASAHALTRALTTPLAEEDEAGEPIVLRTDGPHRTVDGLMALLDEALADEPPDA